MSLFRGTAAAGSKTSWKHRIRAFAAILAIVTAAWPSPVAAAVEPFGLKAGVPATTMAEQDTSFAVEVEPPDPHPEFETYLVHQTPQTGICLVRASRRVEGSAWAGEDTGEKARALFQRIRKQIDKKYGEGKFTESFSIFSYDEQWVKDIRNGNKYYQSVWEIDSDNGVTEVILYLDGFGFNSPYSDAILLKVQYTFPNYNECRAIKDGTSPDIMDSESDKF